MILKLLRLFSYCMERIRTQPSFLPLSPLWLPQTWTIVSPWQNHNPPTPSLSHAPRYQNLSCEAFLGGRPDMEVTQMVDMEIAVWCRKFTNLQLLFGDSPIKSSKKSKLLGSLGAYTPYGYWLLLKTIKHDWICILFLTLVDILPNPSQRTSNFSFSSAPASIFRSCARRSSCKLTNTDEVQLT